eukprot:7032382-Prymnesium_polylepis.1
MVTRWPHDGHASHDGHAMATRWSHDGHTMVTRWPHDGHAMVTRWSRDGHTMATGHTMVTRRAQCMTGSAARACHVPPTCRPSVTRRPQFCMTQVERRVRCVDGWLACGARTSQCASAAPTPAAVNHSASCE